MQLGLRNKNFLVSGASRGIGKSITEKLLEEGCRVGIVARDKNDLARLQKNSRTLWQRKLKGMGS